MGFMEELTKIKAGDISPVTLVLGMDGYLNQLAENTLVSGAFQDEIDEMNFARFNMKDVLVDVALEEAVSLPFFGDKRMVVIEEPYFLTGQKAKAKLDHDIDWFTEYLTNPAESTYLVILAPYEKLDKRKKVTKALLKQAKTLSTESLSEKETVNYVQASIKNKGYKMDSKSFQSFKQMTTLDLTRMMKELEKLMIYKSDTKEIKTEDIYDLVQPPLEQNVFELNRLVLQNKTGESLKVFQDLIYQKEDPIKLIAIMLSQFRLLLQVKILKKHGYQQGDIASVLKTHPYRVKLASQQESQFSQETLSLAHRQLIDTDFAIKSGKMTSETAFELFILQLSDKINNKVLK